MTDRIKKVRSADIILWIVQGIIAITFVWAGFMKIFMPQMLPFPWVKDQPVLVLITGIADILAGFGIILPTIFRVYTKLTIYAACGIIILMLAAIIFHLLRGEASDIGFNIFMIVLAMFVFWKKQISSFQLNKN